MKLGKFKLRNELPNWQNYKNFFGMYIEFDEFGKPEWSKPTRLNFAIYWLRQLKLIYPCWRKGHNLEEDGWAGPDSGGISIHCKRCGWSYQHILY